MENKIEEISKMKKLLMLLGIIFIASNLRAPLTSVGPVISEISKSLALSNTTAGLVTTIPLMAFGFLSSMVPKISRRYGMELVLLGSLILLSIGLVIRPYGSLVTLFLGAALVGIAITVGNVLMPAYIKSNYQKNVGTMMGIYSVAMNLTAALAAGFSISLGKFTEMGWKGSIGVWLVLSIATILIWLPQVKKKQAIEGSNRGFTEEKKVNMYSSKLAWAVTVFMGVQSLLFYCLAAWLPKVAITWGIPKEDAGWLLSYMQFAQLPMTFIGAIIASKLSNQKLLAIGTGVLFAIGIAGLLIFKVNMIALWCVLIGTASGLAFSLSMLFFVLRTSSTTQAAELSGMAQSIGYLIAACGPPVFGALFDVTQSWSMSLMFLLVMSITLIVSGGIAGKNDWVK
ncbi:MULTISPECIES: CynX/NimT family MFS transporter [Myroides]|uniref:MFS transporter, CP family, cyanate transporter n=2 Tax=Myroides TaxID=76831 RepID=A0AAJ4W699_MYRPR|nr:MULTISPECIES: MFS transporter [Myroides]AJA67587.1 Cyanate permease [Myroides sp. A21]AJH16048.1 MFS transporter, CP family, cyanate transporter [Myroides profundi]EHO06585.1 cyanate transporter [Myroides odoratimimus CIP 101113]EPH06711.1 MFS transporter, CP family, cyanate transporter [Myroides odoratimimus CCUG 12700]MDM1060502.1 MFS transporter [Myroides odoratimimus]